ncbi:hypothetical protein AAH991_38120 [Microbispora sp. ZYX-F-249]|uniref:Uncharacterized protein n=1 Tax=Microbispora maris TaxID=3144104 RepID=A0ABV0B0E3_9ACTN
MTNDAADTHRWAINAVIEATDAQMLEALVEGGIRPEPDTQAIVEAMYCNRCGISWEEGKGTPCGVSPDES